MPTVTRAPAKKRKAPAAAFNAKRVGKSRPGGKMTGDKLFRRLETARKQEKGRKTK